MKIAIEKVYLKINFLLFLFLIISDPPIMEMLPIYSDVMNCY